MQNLAQSDSLPAKLKIFARVLAAAILIKGYFVVPPPSVPFFAVLQPIVDFIHTKIILESVIVFCMLFILLGRQITVFSFIGGSAMILSLLLSAPNFANSRLYPAYLFILIGLYEERYKLAPLKFQAILLYFGAALNKICDIDWWNGTYFEGWMFERLQHQIFTDLYILLPEHFLSTLFGVMTILFECAVVAFLVVPRLALYGALFGSLFHGLAFSLTGEDFGAFTAAVFASFFLFLPFSEERKNGDLPSSRKNIFEAPLFTYCLFLLMTVPYGSLAWLKGAAQFIFVFAVLKILRDIPQNERATPVIVKIADAQYDLAS
ncbi:MAG TPA: HTTM domain-containing protein [Oligoflexia bacterium]|nr:HTTM domain-containing protein [Oligoflexia bacterium]